MAKKKKSSSLRGDKKKKSKFRTKSSSKVKAKVKTKSKHKSKSKEAKTTKRRSKYQRGDLGRAIFALFDKVGVDKATFDQALKIAKKAKPDTTYGESYFSWHRNHYKNERDL